eukprot:TRINITY_DN6422_c1_g1_i2.p1 TRINITY_DN6422_c1_g1~~TRINITY_DN6422_c1_g1_i2.p1  ORF type:complete len:285 (-),score=16.50 TRINITY_DN6422_c1_g1_i2:53-907(-)
MSAAVILSFASLCGVTYGQGSFQVPPEDLYIKFYHDNPKCVGVDEVYNHGCWTNTTQRNDFSCRVIARARLRFQGRRPGRRRPFFSSFCTCCGLEKEYVEFGYVCTRYCTDESPCQPDEQDEYGCCRGLINEPLNFGEDAENITCNGLEIDPVITHIEDHHLIPAIPSITTTTKATTTSTTTMTTTTSTTITTTSTTTATTTTTISTTSKKAVLPTESFFGGSIDFLFDSSSPKPEQSESTPKLSFIRPTPKDEFKPTTSPPKPTSSIKIIRVNPETLTVKNFQ